ncbi:ankyrin-2-like [Phymastichus coffea]|uniref:ankyrin-2-like n=1 Tax=Phymastichus coffea TaxID=108790 RepID=UPI00273BDA8C|nr:ankyrin-2-like [Phymastichus coffea]
MDLIRLAQFYKTPSEERKLALLRKVDVSYCVPDDFSKSIQNKYHAGSNCLHFAVKTTNSNLINMLLDRGVDFLKQRTCDGKTPLHIAFYNNNYGARLSGKLRKNNIISILLSIQVKRNQPINPKCKTGVTHLHIACAVNHTEAVKLFVKAKDYLHETTNTDKYLVTPGYTALHFAVKHSSIESTEILLKNGADIHFKDAKGFSALDLLIDRLMDTKDFMCMGKRALCSSYEREIGKLESIAELFLEIKPDHANFISDSGLSTFHLACTLTDSCIGAEFLRQNLDINLTVKNNSQLWPGWTSLHFAACSSVEMFKLLLESGADISIKNAKGETPLDLFTMRYDPKTIHSILSEMKNIKNLLMSDGVTKILDVLLAMNDCNKFSDFLQDLKDVNISVPVESPIWSGFNVLHLAIALNEKTKSQGEFFDKLYFDDDVTVFPTGYNCTEEDEKKYWKRIIVCLAKSCSLKTKNADGVSPIHFAFNRNKGKVVDLLLNNCQDNIVDSNNLSVLHIASAVGRKDVVDRLQKKGTDLNIRTKKSFQWFGKPYQADEDAKPYLMYLRANSTPLHVAVVFAHKNVITYLLKKGADAYAKDELGLTPIHLTLMSFRKRDVRCRIKDIVLRYISNIKESVSNHGLTHLHVAAYANDDRSINELVQHGANVDAIFDAEIPEKQNDEIMTRDLSFLVEHIGMTPLCLAIQGGLGNNAVEALIRNGANIYAQNSKGDTALNSMMDCFHCSFVQHFLKILKQDQRVREPIDPSGMTLLHVACAVLDIDWAKKLLQKGANPNAQIKSNNLEWSDDTPLCTLIFEATVTDRVFVNLENFVKLLLKYGADVTIMCRDSSPLHVACHAANPDPSWDDVDQEMYQERVKAMLVISDLLLISQKSYKFNPIDNHGFSHFHYACLRNKADIVKKFLDNGVDVNMRTDPFSPESSGWIPLHFAFSYKSEAVIRVLLEYGADLDAEDSYGTTPLHIALQNGTVNIKTIETTLSKEADIKSKTIFKNQRSIDYLLELGSITYKQLEYILLHKSSLNITNIESTHITIGLIMQNTDPRNSEEMFTKLVIICDLKKAVNNGFNAIENIVSVYHDGQLTRSYYVESIQMFIEMGCELDQKNENGKTALHEAINHYNLEAIEAMLLLGANMNIVDNNNETPFVIDFLYICNMDDEREVRSLKLVSAYIWKMKFVGLEVLQSNEEAMDAAHKIFPMDLDLQKRCENELNSLQQKSITKSLTMKSFLCESTTLRTYPTMPFAQRKIINNFFDRKSQDLLQFPELAGLLTLQYRMTLQRDKLYGPAKIALSTIACLQLTDYCLENILFHLENKELKKLIEAVRKFRFI